MGYIQIGTSHDTTEFACDSICHWWTTYDQHRYPLADSILLLCDEGGSNSSRYYIFKQDLQGVAKVAEDFKATMKIVFDDLLPQWNYTAVPEVQVI